MLIVDFKNVANKFGYIAIPTLVRYTRAGRDAHPTIIH
jgi:hypothetical protein